MFLLVTKVFCVKKIHYLSMYRITIQSKSDQFINNFFIVTECTAGQFKCHVTMVCIDKSLWCNRIKNCQDGSDEENCRMLIIKKKIAWTLEHAIFTTLLVLKYLYFILNRMSYTNSIEISLIDERMPVRFNSINSTKIFKAPHYNQSIYPVHEL